MNSLDRLTGFYWVARAGGYARAVRAFPYPITEPGVHQQVRRLEAELGVSLFRRVAKDRMSLTAQGQALLAVVAPFLESLRVTVDALRAGRFGGTLRIGAAALLVQELLPGWLRLLHRRHPELDVVLTELRAPDLGLLRSGELDLLVDHLPEAPADVEVRDRKSTRLNSSHVKSSYAVFCLTKKKSRQLCSRASARPSSHPVPRWRRPRLQYPWYVWSRSLFFFFNDTPTTDIYTLSLHDALPIRTLPMRLSFPPGPPPRSLPKGSRSASDRKSTRLNSSHVKISYAVFCLKKKKKNNKRFFYLKKKKKK